VNLWKRLFSTTLPSLIKMSSMSGSSSSSSLSLTSSLSSSSSSGYLYTSNLSFLLLSYLSSLSLLTFHKCNTIPLFTYLMILSTHTRMSTCSTVLTNN
ncbi:hypothetical protein ADUPG1_002701, partial [Aduncisulcus paluster]